MLPIVTLPPLPLHFPPFFQRSLPPPSIPPLARPLDPVRKILPLHGPVLLQRSLSLSLSFSHSLPSPTLLTKKGIGVDGKNG